MIRKQKRLKEYKKARELISPLFIFARAAATACNRWVEFKIVSIFVGFGVKWTQ